MPITGTPAVKRAAFTLGALSAYTEEGPPERITAVGFLASMSSTGMVCGTISEYTDASRTRRAMSWEYWAP